MINSVCVKFKWLFSSNLMKGLGLNGRKTTRHSFISYILDEESSTNGKSYISLPTNFYINEVDSEKFSLDLYPGQDCEFLVEGYGRLLLKEKCMLKKPKKKKVTVFLFEKIILLTTEQKKEESYYYYYASIKISNLSLAPLSHNKKKLLLKDFTHSKYRKSDIEYQLEAKTEEMQNTWREIIQKCLWLQLLSAKDEQNG